MKASALNEANEADSVLNRKVSFYSCFLSNLEKDSKGREGIVLYQYANKQVYLAMADRYIPEDNLKALNQT